MQKGLLYGEQVAWGELREVENRNVDVLLVLHEELVLRLVGVLQEELAPLLGPRAGVHIQKKCVGFGEGLSLQGIIGGAYGVEREIHRVAKFVK